MLVVDASVLAPAIVDAGDEGRRLREMLRGEALAGPDLLRLEVMSVLRRHAAAGHLTRRQASRAVEDLLDFPITAFPTAPLLPRAWALRANLSMYDACYVALAETLDVPLLTGDHRLAGAPGLRCAIEVP